MNERTGDRSRRGLWTGTNNGLVAVAQLVAAAVLCPCFGAEQRFPVEPMTMYRAEKPADVQFYDRDGRALFAGAYRQARLVAAPEEAVTANVKLEPVTVEWKGEPIDDPSFWCETSKVLENTGDRLKVGRSGYALSIYVPVVYDFKCTPDPADTRKGVHGECMNRIWYDRDLRELTMNNSRHLETYMAPTNAAYVRFLIPWSKYDNFTACRLVPARFYTTHPLFLKKGEKFSDRFKGETFDWHPGEIVLAANPDCRERYAAAELVREVKTVTGRRLPVVSAPTKGEKFHIFVGPGFARRDGVLKPGSKAEAKLKGTDGYAILRKGESLYCFGDTGRGTILACMNLLKDVTDLCWWRPNRTCGMNFTPLKEIPFLAEKGRACTPVFAHRSFTYGGNPCSPAYDDWAVRHDFFRGYHVPVIFAAQHYHAKSHGFYAQIGDTFLGLVFNHGGEGKEEWWPMQNGKRQVGTNVGQPCYSNPEVVAETVRSVNGILDDPPEEWDSFCFDYSDSWNCCECPACLKPIALPQGGTQECKHMLATKDPHFRSTRTYLVANEVAKAVTARYPEKPVTMLAYIYTAPKPAVKLHPAIRVKYATYDTTTMRFPTKEQDRPIMYAPEGWAQRTEAWCREEPQALGMYEYYFTASPAMFAEAAATNLQQMADCGGTYAVHSQTQWDDDGKSGESFGRNCQMWDMNAMDQVLIARLFWNPHQDVDALRSEFLRRVYGEGAADMAEYYRIFRKRWFDRSFKTWMNCHTPPPAVYTDFVIKPKIERQLYACVERAMAKTTSPAAKLHLGRMLQTMKDLRAATGRVDIPFVPEMAQEYESATSPQWNRAYTLENFRDALPDPSDPAQMTCNLVKTPPALSKTKTRVDFACDRKYLYWRVTPDANGGYVEFWFQKGKPSKRHSFYCEAKGVRTGRIPMAAIRPTPTNVITYVVRRFDAKGVCSFGRAAENKTRAFPGENHRSFSTLDPEVESVFDAADEKLGLNAKPPIDFADPELKDHPLTKLFTWATRGDGGQAMRRVRGVPVYDTGYGSGFVKGFAAKAGDEFVVTGDRWRYGPFSPVVAWFYGPKGKIRETSMKWEDCCKDGPFRFQFSCPDGTTSFQLMIYDSYVKELKVERAASD